MYAALVVKLKHQQVAEVCRFMCEYVHVYPVRGSHIVQGQYTFLDTATVHIFMSGLAGIF